MPCHVQISLCYEIHIFRGPTHPLISVLINRPDSWPFLVENTASLLSHKEK
ncbi:hypothetical protein BgiBS90_022046, partial [Biomphalaria glabrata]